MTRLVLVHGRAQQGKDPITLRQSWLDALTVTPGGLPADVVNSAAFPFYGDALESWTYRRIRSDAVARGSSVDPSLVDEFDEAFVRDIQRQAGIDDPEVEAELPAGAVQRGLANWEWVQGVGRVLDKRAPGLGQLALRLLADVKTYLTVSPARDAVDEIVTAPIADALGAAEGLVVVGHSLGSVVAYRILRALMPDDSGSTPVPLFLTVGSPLGIRVVKDRLRPPALGKPSIVDRWANATDDRDPVALHAALGKAGFPGVTDHTQVRNPRDDPHGIAGYLQDLFVRRALRGALVRE